MKRYIIFQTLFYFILIVGLFYFMHLISKNWILIVELHFHKWIHIVVNSLVIFLSFLSYTFFFYKKTKALFFLFLTILLLPFWTFWNHQGSLFVFYTCFCIPYLLILFWGLSKSRFLLTRKLEVFSILRFIFLILFLFTFLFYAIPFVESGLNVLVKKMQFNYLVFFSENFIIEVGQILIYVLFLVGFTMLVLGYNAGWFFLIIKCACQVIFVLLKNDFDFWILISNFFYLLLFLCFVYKNCTRQSLKVAILGPGGVGKTTVINFLDPFLKKNYFHILKERKEFINEKFHNYMNNLSKHAFNHQKYIFEKRFAQFQEMQNYSNALMDRHVMDDFIYPRVHVQLGNFTREEKHKWHKIENKYWKKLKQFSKVDLTFILVVPENIAKERRKLRSAKELHRKEELKNQVFFQTSSDFYYNHSSILYKATKEFSQKTYFVQNFSSKKTAKKIAKIITQKLSE